MSERAAADVIDTLVLVRDATRASARAACSTVGESCCCCWWCRGGKLDFFFF